MNTIGFIILRHVNNEQTGIYWKKCYESIRRFYKKWISFTNNVLIYIFNFR